jgi:exoribonuclease R
LAWKAEDGVLHLDASQKGDWQTKNGGDMVSNEEYENFDLKLEWKISKAGNSGILFHVKEDTTKYKYSYFTGPECQVVDNKENEDGKLIKHRAGDLYDLISISKEVVKPAGEWNQLEIVCNNSKLDFTINGEHVLSTTLWDDNWKKLVAGSKFKEWPDFGTFKSGHIVLQDHGADVWYRNIEIKKL